MTLAYMAQSMQQSKRLNNTMRYFILYDSIYFKTLAPQVWKDSQCKIPFYERVKVQAIQLYIFLTILGEIL